MSGNDRCKMYKETQSSIIKILEKGLTIDKNICVNQIVLIRSDVSNNDENVKKAALDMLDFLLTLNIEDIQMEVIKILHDTSANKLMQNHILKSIKKIITETIIKDTLNFKDVLLPWKNQNINKLTTIIEDVCLNVLPKDKCKHFFINNVIPTMMSISTSNGIRNTLTDIAFMLSTIVPISDLSTKELEVFLTDVNTKYIKNIGELRDQDYPNWHNLWIFLVRFCDKHIHSSMDLTNRLLRVVEYAFRNSSVQQRLRGYDCWKELIDNASLDMNHMCSPKQIKLLVTPLKAKFSKQEVVICKRFDVFTYLLEKLQHKAVLCLEEFLEFCFGPIGDNKDATKTGQGKSVPEIWTKSTKVLVDIIGHSHAKFVSCISIEDVIKLEKPVINYSNISTYYKVIIRSVGECCILLKEIDIESKREMVVKCMWKSVLNLVLPSPDSSRKKYFLTISEILDNYIRQSRENPYFEDLLTLIFSVLMTYEVEFVYDSIQYILKQLLTVLFTVDNFPVTVADNFTLALTHAFSKIIMVENKLKMVKEVVTSFMRLKTTEENIIHINKIWQCLATEILDLTAGQIEECMELHDFFMWPSFYLHHLDDAAKKQIVLHWMKLYRKITLDSECKKQSLLKELEKSFKNNPLLSSNVVSLLNIMSQFETKFSKEFVIKLMNVSSQILHLPILKTDDEQKISALVMQYFEPSLECYKYEGNDEVIENICTCIKHILCIHNGYKLLDNLANFIRNAPDALRSKFAKQLSNLLLDLYNKESDAKGYSAKELYKVIQAFNVENAKNEMVSSPFMHPGGRSARIAKLVKNSPKSPQRKTANSETPTSSLRLFGKDLETLSPLQVKGSQLKNITPRKSRKTVNTPKSKVKSLPSINDERSMDFVPINTEVKFQPEKLSKHQREVLRKRREDIPALYQDLSQSLSQDMFSSDSSKGPDKDDKENSADNRKVIVEVIGHQFKDTVLQAEDNVTETVSGTSEIIPAVPTTETTKDVLLENKNSIPDAVITDDNVENVENKNADPDETMYTELERGDKVEDKQEEEHNKPLDVNEKVKMVDEEPGNVEEKQQKEEILHPVEKEIEDTSTDKSDDHIELEKKRKIKAELQKLKMDIVGADEFLAMSSRRTRSSTRPKKLDETPPKKSKNSNKEVNSTSQQLHDLRKSLNLENFDTIIEKNRRKTIDSFKGINTTDIGATVVDNAVDNLSGFLDQSIPEIQNQSAKKSNNKDKPATPRRKSSNVNLEESLLVSNDKDEKPIEKIEKQAKSIITRNKTPRKLGTKENESRENEKLTRSGRKRKCNSDELSEDIIESSQAFDSEVTPVFNSSKRKNVEVSIEEEIKPDVEVKQDENVSQSDDKCEEIKDTVFLETDINFNDGAIETEIVEQIDETPFYIQDVGQEVVVNGTGEHTSIDLMVQQFDTTGDIQKDVNTTQDTTVTEEESTQTQDLTQNNSQDMETQDTETQTQDTQTQDTQTQSEFAISSEDTRPPVLYFDLPKKPELTDSERIMCRMDTMSICSDPNNLTLKYQAGVHQSLEEIEVRTEVQLEEKLLKENVLATPKSKITSRLPSSPITVETPTRTTELLNDTLDISPINSKNSSDSEIPEHSSVPVSINFKAEMDELDKIAQEIVVERIVDVENGKTETNHSNLGGIEELNKPGEVPNLLEDILNDLNEIPNVSEKITQIDNMPLPMVEAEMSSEKIPQLNEEVGLFEEIPYQIADVEKQTIDIPSHSESKPIKENVGIQERASKLLNMLNINSPVNNKLFIKKRSGGVTMSPSTARIKRLMSNFNQKQSSDDLNDEVKNEDILTFSREVPSPLAVPRTGILKRKLCDLGEPEGISPCAKRKRVNFSDPCLTSKKLFIKDDYHEDHPALEAKCLFTPEVKTKDDQLKDFFEFSENPSNSETLSESENIDSEPSLQIVNPLILRKDKPIYPKLVGSTEDVILILKRVTSPMFITTLLNKLKNKDIKTIGDLAGQSEAEINRFPFKVPQVSNVYKALDKYYKKNIDKIGRENIDNEQHSRVNGVDEDDHKNVLQKFDSIGADIISEFKELIEKSKIEGSLEELGKILLSSLENRQLVTLIKTHCKIDFKDFLEEKDFKYVTKHVTEVIGLPSIFDVLRENIHSSEEESVYYDCITKESNFRKPFNQLESLSLADIKHNLEECINKNIFNKQDLLDTCLLPLIESPRDIHSYVNQMSVVELGSIVVKRIQSTDLQTFLNQILEAYDSKNVTTVLNDELFKHLKSTGDIISSFKNCINAQPEANQSEVMVEMFKFISGKLELHTLLELHVDFLKRIPKIVADNEKK